MKALRCRLGGHAWRHLRTPDGGRFVACRRCGKDGPASATGGHPGILQ